DAPAGGRGSPAARPAAGWAPPAYGRANSRVVRCCAWHTPCCPQGVLSALWNALARARPDATGDGAHGDAVDALERSDLAAINHWLSVTRIRTGVFVVVAVPGLSVIGGLDLPW